MRRAFFCDHTVDTLACCLKPKSPMINSTYIKRGGADDRSASGTPRVAQRHTDTQPPIRFSLYSCAFSDFQLTYSGSPLDFEHSKFGNPSRDTQIDISTLRHLTRLSFGDVVSQEFCGRNKGGGCDPTRRFKGIVLAGRLVFVINGLL